MSLVVGDVGTIIELDIVEVNENGVAEATEFTPGVDTVKFKFKDFGGTTIERNGTFITGSKARYVTVSGDITTPGRLEIQLEITSTAWTGSSDTYVTKVLEKFVATT